MYRRFVGNYAARVKHVLVRSHTPKVGEHVWFATKQVEGEITWIGEGAKLFMFGSGTPSKRKRTQFRYFTTVYTNDVVYDQTLHAWLVGEGPVPDHLLRGTVIRPDPVEIRVVQPGRM
jgi:hypothetical protein